MLWRYYNILNHVTYIESKAVKIVNKKKILKKIVQINSKDGVVAVV